MVRELTILSVLTASHLVHDTGKSAFRLKRSHPHVSTMGVLIRAPPSLIFLPTGKDSKCRIGAFIFWSFLLIDLPFIIRYSVVLLEIYLHPKRYFQCPPPITSVQPHATTCSSSLQQFGNQPPTSTSLVSNSRTSTSSGCTIVPDLEVVLELG
jgi:hypothetical protein